MSLIKTYKEWTGDLYDYLEVGDRVDEEMYQHFLNILPPLISDDFMLQVSEKYSCVNGRDTYTTFYYENGYWTYAGNCYRGEVVNRCR